MSVATSMMDMVIRLELCQVYPHEISMCADWLDLVLTSIWSKCKKAGMTGSSWVKNQRSRACLVLEIANVEKVLAASDFKTVCGELNALCSGSRLGNALFGWTLVPLVSEKISAAIDLVLTQFRKEGGVVTSKRLAELHALCNAKVRDEMICSVGAKEVSMRYRGFELKVTCATPWEEILLKTASLLKGLAVDQGVLSPLFVESELLAVVRVKTEEESSLKVHADVASPWEAARRAASDSMNRDFTAKEIVTTLTKRLQTYIALDSTFGLELALFKSLGSSPGEKALLDQMIACLPSEPVLKYDFGDALRSMVA
eukprot:6490686-Amphidinium_carterae.4